MIAKCIIYIYIYMETSFDLTAHVKSKLLSAIRSCSMKTMAKAISHLQKQWSVTATTTPYCSSRQPRRYIPPSKVQLRDVVATWPFLSCPCVILAMFYLLCSETGICRWYGIPLISSKQKAFYRFQTCASALVTSWRFSGFSDNTCN